MSAINLSTISMSKIKIRVIATIIISTLALSGCQTTEPYTGERKTSNALKYGAIGAVICGIIGSRKSGKRARQAAAGCGLIGAGVGAYMDSQEKKLRESLEATGVGVQREGDNIRLVMPGNITFATNQANIQTSFEPVLNSVVTVLREYDETIVEVEGYTDSTGSLAHNNALSQRRAQSVADYLNAGDIIRERLLVTGKGPSNPIASNSTSEGRAQNRRVEIRIRPIKAQS